MIDRDAEPIGHEPPRRRIEIGGTQVGRPAVTDEQVGMLRGDLAKRVADRIEAERIWRLVRQAAGGAEAGDVQS